MKSNQSMITLVGVGVLTLLALTLISFTPRTPAIEALDPSDGEFEPMVGFDTVEYTVTAGDTVPAGLLFAYFPCIDNNDDGKCNYEDDFTTVTYRFDILQNGANVDNCEGHGWGSKRNFSPSLYNHWRSLSPIPLRVSSSCPEDDYTMRCTVTYTEPGSTEAIPLTCNGDLTVGAVQPPTATPTNTPAHTSTPTNTATATATVDDSILNQLPQNPTATPTLTEMPPPMARIQNLPVTFSQGQQPSFKIIFENLDESDQYGYRADVVKMADDSAADNCEGAGLGGSGPYTDHLTGMIKNQVSVPGQIDPSCQASKYAVTVKLMADSGYEYATSQEFQVVEVEIPTATHTPTATPAVTPTDDLSADFPDRIISVADDDETDLDAGAFDTADIAAAPQTTSAGDDGSGSAYDIVATIPKGTWAEIIAVGDCPPNVWYQIIVPGLDEPGWIHRGSVKLIGSLANVPHVTQ